MIEYLTPTQIAERFGVSLVTAQRWCRQGLFYGAIQVGRSWGVPVEALDAFDPPKIGNPTMGPDFWTPKRRKRLSRAKKKKSKNP